MGQVGVEDPEPKLRLVLPEVRDLAIIKAPGRGEIHRSLARSGSGGVGHSRNGSRSSSRGSSPHKLCKPLCSKRIQLGSISGAARDGDPVGVGEVRRPARGKVISGFLEFLSMNTNIIVSCSMNLGLGAQAWRNICLLYTSPSPRDLSTSRMPSSA